VAQTGATEARFNSLGSQIECYNFVLMSRTVLFE
jgi:hypothetical protein